MSSMVSEALNRIREALSNGEFAEAFYDIRSLTLEQLRIQDYQKIDYLIDEYWEQWQDYLPGKKLRIAILGGYTTQPIRLAIRTAALSEGFLVRIYEAEYNTYQMTILDSASELYDFEPDMVLLAIGSVNIKEFPKLGASSEEVDHMVQSVLQHYQYLWKLVRDRTRALILQHNFEPIEGSVLGHLEGRYSWSRSRFIQRINEGLWSLDGHGGVRIVDVCGLVSRIGSYDWFDPRWFYHSKHSFAPKLTFEYARLFAGLLRPLIGKPKKCLVVDLDNTLWGGIIGDDSLDRIRLGTGSAEGEAFLAFCHYVKLLKERGVILAVNSKNDPDVAAEVFENHPQMPLEMDDFAAFYCNWESKAVNIRAIAKELNIGIDSLVFIDDNPVECAEVRLREPLVTVVEMMGDPAYFIRRIEQFHLFDQLDLTDDDFNRPQSYVAKRKIADAEKSSVNLEEFLTGLDMIAKVKASMSSDLPRIEQLFKKTNQFNLTSRQYDQTLLSQLVDQPDGVVLSCRLKDKFADYGLVAAIVGSIQEDKLQIDNWVMSCRVFSRTFEEYILNYLKNLAKEWHCSVICGEFNPTKKNGYVANLYRKFGFSPDPDTVSFQWVLHLSDAPELKSFIQDGS